MKSTAPHLLVLVAALLALSGPLPAQEDLGMELLPPIDHDLAEPRGFAEPIGVGDEILQEAVGSGWASPLWMPSRSWFHAPFWEHSIELGMNGSEGNSQSFSILAAVHMKRKTDASTLNLDLKYSKTNANGVETQNFALFDSRWDWSISPTLFLYEKNTLEYDQFKAFDLRYASAGGLGHHFIKNDATELTARLGAGVSREFGGPDNDWVPEANLGVDFEHQLSVRQKLKATIDYYPAWERFTDFRLVTDAFWEILLDEEAHMSLKLGAVDRYDSTPNDRKSNDVDYYMTLLWKF